MIGTKRGSTLPSWSKNFVSTQTWDDLVLRYNASCGFDATLGLGYSGTATTCVIFTTGGFADQRVTAVLRFTSPVTAGAEDLGVMFRFRNVESGVGNYYYARLFHSLATIYKVVAGSFTLLASGAFVLPVNTDMTITVNAIGSLLTADFVASGVTTVNLSCTDSTHVSGGAGIVSISTAGSIWCKSASVEQLR